MVKIVDAIKRENESGRHYFGFEFVAPTSEAGAITLYDRIERLSSFDPLFCGVTWGSHGSTAETSAEVASTCQTLLSVNYQVNITGYTSSPEDVTRWLSGLKAKGVRNLLITRGNAAAVAKSTADLPVTSTAMRAGDTDTSEDIRKVHFPHAADLIRYARSEFGNYFGIAAVATPEAADVEKELKYLKEKVDAGADYLITQSVFDVDVFTGFVAKCKERGIRCPILPGILPITHLRQLRNFELSSLAGVSELAQRIEAVPKQDDKECRQVVVVFLQELVRKLFAAGVGGVYFFTLNSDAIVPAIIRGLSLATQRAFPWKPSENEERRRKETVRPIHWSSRVTSYMVRTAQWKDFQSTEKGGPDLWGNLGGYHAKLLLRSRAKRCTQFLSLGRVTDVLHALEELCRIFVNFLSGNGTLPWADELSGETEYLNEILLKPLNTRGLFTINSQPQVDGFPSTHRVVGWGPRNGLIYQKGYIEFFCPAATAQTVFTTLDKYAALQYMAMDSQGKLARSSWPVEEPLGRGGNSDAADGEADDSTGPLPSSATAKLFGSGITTVTWGVFPGREVIQPTIVSVDSFRAWVGEAFDLWAAPFPSNDIPPVIQMIQSEWVLVSVVDNLYQQNPSALERAVLEVCSKIPPLVSVETASMTSPLGGTTTASQPDARD